MSRLLRDSAWTLVAEAVTAVATLAGGILVARATGAEGKGVFTLATGFAAIGAGVIGFRWERPTGYFLARNRKDLPAIVASVFVMAAVATLGGVALWIGCPALVSGTVLRGIDHRSITVATGLIGTHFLFVSIPALYGGLREFRLRSMFLSAAALPLLVPPAFLYAMGERDVAVYLRAYLVTCGAVYGAWLVAFTTTHAGWPRVDVRLWKRMIRYGSLSYASLVMDFVTVRLDLFLLNYLISSTEVGIYSVAVGIATRIASIPNILSHVVFHRVSANEIGNGETTRRILNLTTIVMVVAGLAVAAAGSLVIVPFYGAEFARSVGLLFVMIPASIVWGLFRLLASDVEGRGRPGLVSACSFIGSAGIVVLDLLWIPRYGAMGAAWASLVAYGAAFVCCTVAFARVTGLRPYGACATTGDDVATLAATVGRIARVPVRRA